MLGWRGLLGVWLWDQIGLVGEGRIVIEDSCDVMRQGYHILGKCDWLIVVASSLSEFGNGAITVFGCFLVCLG